MGSHTFYMLSYPHTSIIPRIHGYKEMLAISLGVRTHGISMMVLLYIPIIPIIPSNALI